MATATGYEYTGETPLNREPEIEDLLSSYITTKGPYDRNHGPIPSIDASTHVLKIDGAVETPLELSISQLQNDFAQHEVLCTLQCAGNRRHTMRTLIKEVNGIDWYDGAVMNCIWRGPRLRDVFSKAGVGETMVGEKGYNGYAAFACYETECQDDSWYGGSVSLERAMMEEGDCILALKMNGEPLTPKHGAPVRALIPGIAGARSVKWINQITLQLNDSPNFYQQHDYKILPPEATDVKEAEKYWHTVPPMMDMPVNSVVGIPKTGSTIKLSLDNTIEVQGYAVPEGIHGPVVKVEVSVDDGESWANADLNYGGQGDLVSEEGRREIKWAWCLWHARVKTKRGMRRIVCRAIDAGGNSQQEKGVWNLRGVGYNAWGEARDLRIV